MIEVLDLKFKEIISAEKIQERVKELATELNENYRDKNPIFLGILNGSFMFVADLFKNVNIPCEISFLKLYSYENTRSTEKVKELIGLNQSIQDRHVIIVEDIVDTGRTLDFILKTLAIKKPASIAVASLLYKPTATIIPVEVDYLGFEIENKFVLGYGLDYNGYGRNHNSILVKMDE